METYFLEDGKTIEINESQTLELVRRRTSSFKEAHHMTIRLKLTLLVIALLFFVGVVISLVIMLPERNGIENQLEGSIGMTNEDQHSTETTLAPMAAEVTSPTSDYLEQDTDITTAYNMHAKSEQLQGFITLYDPMGFAESITGPGFVHDHVFAVSLNFFLLEQHIEATSGTVLASGPSEEIHVFDVFVQLNDEAETFVTVQLIMDYNISRYPIGARTVLSSFSREEVERYEFLGFGGGVEELYIDYN